MPETVTHSAAIVLQAVAKGYRHGFDIIELTGLTGSTIYPALRRMERNKLVRASWERATIAREHGRPPRKYYDLTEGGQVALAAALERFRFLQPFAAQLEPKETLA